MLLGPLNLNAHPLRFLFVFNIHQKEKQVEWLVDFGQRYCFRVAVEILRNEEV